MIFYLSATGNTKWAAQILADATGEELICITDSSSLSNVYKLKPSERIGFCFPVHGWRPPFLFREFVRRLRFEKPEGHYCYALCTAGDNIGESMKLLQQDLQECALRLDSCYSLIMPESYVGLPFMDVDKPEREKQKKETAARLLETFKQAIVERKKGESELVMGHWPRINSRIIGSYFLNHLVTDKPFHVETDRCTACGICARVCPVGNIEGGRGMQPTWKHTGRCLTCFACYHHCPQHAIEFGNRTQHKGQYFFK